MTSIYIVCLDEYIVIIQDNINFSIYSILKLILRLTKTDSKIDAKTGEEYKLLYARYVLFFVIIKMYIDSNE